MKKVLIGSAILLLSSAVSAQASTFEGFAVGLGLGQTTANLNATNNGYWGTSGVMQSLAASSMVPRIDLSYTKALAGKMLLDGGITYDLGDTKTADIPYYGGYLYGENADAAITRHYSLYVAPGYTLNDSMSAFVKVGYNYAHQTYSELYVGNLDASMKGVSLGLGFKYLVNDNVFIKGEFESVKYNTVHYYSDYAGYGSDMQTKVTSTTVTLGYKF